MNPSIASPALRVTPAARRDTPRLSPAVLSRVAGVCTLGYLALGLSDQTGTMLHANPSTQHILAWAVHNERLIYLGGWLSALGSTLLGVAIVLLLSLTGRRGVLPTLACVGVAVAMATGWTKDGVLYALAELAHRGGADAGVQALFMLGGAMDFTDGIAWALAVGSLSVVLLHTRLLPPPIGWFGVLVAGVLAVSGPVSIAGGGFINPVDFSLGLLWSLALGLALLVRPVQTPVNAAADVYVGT